jgi:hypothetical protein
VSYTFDPDTRDYVSRLLWEALPGYYRDKDRPPTGQLVAPAFTQGELQAFLRILAVPLAFARQNIEELHANLFIDTSDDWVIALLAEMVGTTLVFPDAASNRRDVRDTVSWRRQKGTPPMLQNLGSELTGHLVAMREGWKLVQISQDLNLLRRERIVPDLRLAIVAELDDGPLVTLHHSVDARAISGRTGKYHPRQIVHWAHPTQFFEVRAGTPANLRVAADPDFRFAFHPMGEFLPLRARRAGEEDTLKTDSVPPLHFAASPGDWFGQPGRFSILIRGIPAAVTDTPSAERVASALAATPEVMNGDVTLTLLRADPRRFHGPVRVEVIAVPVAAPGPAVPDIIAASIQVRSRIDLDAGGATPTVVVNGGPVDPTRLVMLRLTSVGSAARFFPGAEIEISGAGVSGVMGAVDAALAAEGFLRGALFVQLPAAMIRGELWYCLAADGSLYAAQSLGTGAVDIQVSDTAGQRLLPGSRLRVAGPGPVWPPQLPVFDPQPQVAVPSAPGFAPAVMHGGRVVRAPAGAWQDVAGAANCSLVLAASLFDGQRRYHPFLRLSWIGPDPSAAAAAVIGDDGLAAANAGHRFRQIADLREAGANQFRLVIRFESDVNDAIMTPFELGYTSFDGRSLLVYAPSLACQAANPAPNWQTAPAFTGISAAVAVGQDGSTWQDAMALNARMSSGQVAPLEPYRPIRRRRVHYRSLCQWRNEVPPGLMHAATIAGFLNIDPQSGLFSMALSEPPDGAVTVVYQQGYTRHTGALPAAREPELDERLANPTRLVSASGRLHEAAPPAWHELPLYATLGAALAAIQAAPQVTEVIQVEDTATYPGEAWTWPAGCRSLTVQAAERGRPVIGIVTMNSALGAAFDEIVLCGLSLGGPAGAFAFPPAAQIRVQFCTVTGRTNEFQFQLSGGPKQVSIIRSVIAGLRLSGPGLITVADSVIDTGAGLGVAAIVAADGRVELDRVTVFGPVAVFVLEASEVIFNDLVTVIDRFQGCVRYSRVTGLSMLPRRHRVVVDVPVRYVSVNRQTPEHARLAESCDRRVLCGAEDGSEMGAFHDVQQAQRYEAFFRRLIEYTPAGLTTGIIRID